MLKDHQGSFAGSRILSPRVALASAFLTICIAANSEAQTPQTSKLPSVTGRTIDGNGKPIPYVHVFEAVTGQTTVTSHAGEFALQSLGPGNMANLNVRRIGYRPIDTSLVIADAQQVRVELVLQPVGEELNTVTVRATRSDYDDFLDRSGFYRRMAQKTDGRFLSAKQIDRRNATELTAVLRDMPGVRVVSRSGRSGNSYVLGRGGLCALGLVVDGQKIATNAPPREQFQPRITSIMGGRPVIATETKRGDASIDQLVSLSMVAGIEVYPSAASVPNSLHHHAEDCGLIVVWTRFKL